DVSSAPALASSVPHRPGRRRPTRTVRLFSWNDDFSDYHAFLCTPYSCWCTRSVRQLYSGFRISLYTCCTATPVAAAQPIDSLMLPSWARNCYFTRLRSEDKHDHGTQQERKRTVEQIPFRNPAGGALQIRRGW